MCNILITPVFWTGSNRLVVYWPLIQSMETSVYRSFSKLVLAPGPNFGPSPSLIMNNKFYHYNLGNHLFNHAH